MPSSHALGSFCSRAPTSGFTEEPEANLLDTSLPANIRAPTLITLQIRSKSGSSGARVYYTCKNCSRFGSNCPNRESNIHQQRRLGFVGHAIDRCGCTFLRRLSLRRLLPLAQLPSTFHLHHHQGRSVPPYPPGLLPLDPAVPA